MGVSKMKICVVALAFLVVILAKSTSGTPIPVSFQSESTVSEASIAPQTTRPSIQPFTGPVSIQTITTPQSIQPFTGPTLPSIQPFTGPVSIQTITTPVPVSIQTITPRPTLPVFPTPGPAGFDGGAFGGGIALGIGICVILLVAFICYTRRKGANYKAM